MNNKTPLKAIRLKCLDCTCDSVEEIRECPIESCPIYPYRFGKNPYNKKNLSEEQRKALSERMKSLRKNK